MNDSPARSRSTSHPAPPSAPGLGWFACAALLGLTSAALPPLSIFAVLALVIALAATSRLKHARKTAIVSGLALAMGLALLGLGRFALGDALQGIIEARGRETSTHAVSTLREILFAQDAMRRYAFIDPDRDQVGGAGLLEELSGTQGARGGALLATPPLAPRFAPARSTKAGLALEKNGYLYLICLPARENGWTTSVGDPIDEERAERTWIAYAWPASPDAPHRSAFFIDAAERILQSANETPTGLRLAGALDAPLCSDAETHAGQWTPWRGKQPRAHLPGDRPREAR